MLDLVTTSGNHVVYPITPIDDIITNHISRLFPYSISLTFCCLPSSLPQSREEFVGSIYSAIRHESSTLLTRTSHRNLSVGRALVSGTKQIELSVRMHQFVCEYRCLIVDGAVHIETSVVHIFSTVSSGIQ